MNEEKISLRMMPWKHRLMIITSIIVLFFYISRTQFSLISLKNCLFLIIMTIAAITDSWKRIIPNWIHGVVILIGLIDFNICISLIGFLLAPLPFLFCEIIKPGSIGGGDIKLIASIGFAFGLFQTMKIYIVGLIILVFVWQVSIFFKKIVRKKKTPLVPYFWSSCIIQLGVIYGYLL